MSDSNKKRKIEYKCHYCDKTFSRTSKVVEHERSHTGERPFVCTFDGCDKTYSRSHHLKVHERAHLAIKDFKCTFENCTKAYATKQHLQRHEKTHVAPNVKCDYPGCTAEFSKRFQLRWHRASHEKATHICDVCSVAFDSLPALEKHKQRVHENPVTYNCSTCERAFSKWSELRKHMVHDHPAKCTICNKTYTKSFNLRNHIREKHTEKCEVQCEWPGCESILQSKRSYKMHVALVHEQDTRFRCNICEKGFPYKSMLERHKGSHTPKSRTSSPKPQKTLVDLITGHGYFSKITANLECPFENCQYKFTNTYLLKRHLEGNIHKQDIKILESSNDDSSTLMST